MIALSHPSAPFATHWNPISSSSAHNILQGAFAAGLCSRHLLLTSPRSSLGGLSTFRTLAAPLLELDGMSSGQECGSDEDRPTEVHPLFSFGLVADIQYADKDVRRERESEN